MSVSHKYRTFNQLYEDVSIDFANYALENMIEPQQLIKVATRVNYDLGLRIHRTKEEVLEIEHGKAKLPDDFAYLNYAYRCGDYTIADRPPGGTHIETFNDVPYVPAPGESGPCDDPGSGRRRCGAARRGEGVRLHGAIHHRGGRCGTDHRSALRARGG